jgi:3-hydroxyacyl-CoA dehydrogenase
LVYSSRADRRKAPPELLGQRKISQHNGLAIVSITKIASSISNPQRCVGLHFFNPVSVMPLVEIVRGLESSDATHEAAAAFAEQLGKHPSLSEVRPGFVVNRTLLPMINEAFFVLAEGYASAEDTQHPLALAMRAIAREAGLDSFEQILIAE